MAYKKVFVVVENGLVTEAYSNVPGLHFEVIDLDTQDSAEEGETQERYREMEDLVSNSFWKNLIYEVD